METSAFLHFDLETCLFVITAEVFPMGVHCLSEFSNLGHNYEQKKPILVRTLPHIYQLWT